MFEPYWRKVVVAGCVIMLALAVVAWSPSIGQDKKAEKPKAAKKEKEVKGTLPPYFKDVVSEEQRSKIYAIQAKYRPQIDDLQSQLEELRKKQSDEIDAVLTKEQLDKVASQRDAAAAAKKKKSDDAKKSDAKKTDAAAKTEAK